MWVQIIFKISPLGEDHNYIIWVDYNFGGGF